MELSLWQRVCILLKGSSFVGIETPPGWKPTKFYAIHCQKHGFQKSYKQGYAEALYCPECTRELIAGISVRETNRKEL